MLLGINKTYGGNPDDWIRIVRSLGVGAVVLPYGPEADAATRRAYRALIQKDGLVVGEAGVWRNCLDPDPAKRRAAIAYAEAVLALADEAGARCCVNVSGSAGPDWDRYDPGNYSKAHRALLIDTLREIVDAVRPARTYFALEPMPWMRPDSPEDYLALLADADRPRLAAHMDTVNMLNSFSRYRDRDAFIRRCFRLLGGRIKSVHVKDVKLESGMPLSLREVTPGDGDVDLSVPLGLTAALPGGVPAFAEHLPNLFEYRRALSAFSRAARGL